MSDRLPIVLHAFLMALLLVTPAVSLAQDTLAVVYGTVKDLSTKKPIAAAQVEVLDLKWGRRTIVVANDSGRYDLNLTEEADYLIEYGALGHVPKRVRIVLRGPTPEQWVGGFGMNIDINLFREVLGLDLTMGGEPFGICTFDTTYANFQWDVAYTAGMRDRAEALMKEYERRVPTAR